ncbi:MAG TPA: hypothetical protein VM051_06080 [Usitatibacter sp.]|nr:hypothetical protein [Usitatibacter sp.]
MPLDLLVPELLCASPAGRLRCVERWLSRADKVRDPARSATAWLGKAFGLDPVPVAALEQAACGVAGGSWMRADPVHLRVEGDALRLHEAALLSISKEEASTLVAMLQSHFAADGIEFHARTPERWYVRLGAGEAPATTPLDEAAGRNVFGLIPADAKWRNALTEAQMLLSAHEVNARREAEGKPPINSIWFWGAGALPAARPRTYATVYANDPLARGLGDWSGARVQALPAGIADIDLERESESTLAVVSHTGAELEQRWFGPLARAIDRFDRVRLILPSRGDTLVATLTPSARWRLFRGSKPLSAYA